MAASEEMAKLREELELEKLQEELSQLKKEPRHWLTRNVLQVAVAALISAAVGVFVSSLEARRQSEIRKDVLSKYLELDNTQVGKRMQMLSFVELVLDDAKLDDWVRSERETLEDATSELEAKIQEEEKELEAALDEMERLVGRLDEALSSEEQSSGRAESPGDRRRAAVQAGVESLKLEVERAEKARKKTINLGDDNDPLSGI